jgi:hypothetical protein
MAPLYFRCSRAWTTLRAGSRNPIIVGSARTDPDPPNWEAVEGFSDVVMVGDTGFE